MAAIVISSLNTTVSGAIYKDIDFDLQVNYTRNKELFKKSEVGDLAISENIGAIQNSIFNLFTTSPGQKILNPLYGINLTQYLFAPVSVSQAQIIGEAILTGVRKFEPRVTVNNIAIENDYDNNQYNISLLLSVPSLNIYGISVKGVLNESGYYLN